MAFLQLQLHLQSRLIQDGIRAGLECYKVKITYDRIIKNQTIELELALEEAKRRARSKTDVHFSSFAI